LSDVKTTSKSRNFSCIHGELALGYCYTYTFTLLGASKNKEQKNQPSSIRTSKSIPKSESNSLYLSSSFSPFPLSIGAPLHPLKITLPKRKRILSYLFNGLIIEQRIHQSFLPIHAYEED
jgi:hypothetical protein